MALRQGGLLAPRAGFRLAERVGHSRGIHRIGQISGFSQFEDMPSDERSKKTSLVLAFRRDFLSGQPAPERCDDVIDLDRSE